MTKKKKRKKKMFFMLCTIYIGKCVKCAANKYTLGFVCRKAKRSGNAVVHLYFVTYANVVR